MSFFETKLYLINNISSPLLYLPHYNIVVIQIHYSYLFPLILC
ncbi:Uncharacterised protein [Escherichia coli]|nr:Uncharacterised protein [Escherichia coli]SQS51633.1 Uncharacterised protein [Escherichia coli]SQW19394.1 Uncharacterised protein [Escherichia coli]SQW46942.1 Uncharacterised protein [Escherichia coli]SQW74079.1 Uncharacterised protein [Escherichia coli]